jgi:histidinol dehydrogenase
MMKVFRTTESPLPEIAASLSTRGQMETQATVDAVRAIIADVAQRGDDAVLHYTRTFDSASAARLQVHPDEVARAADQTTPDFGAALAQAAHNIRAFHEAERSARGCDEGVRWLIERPDGARLGELVRPVGRVAVMVPGKAAPCPSTVLMSAIPARVAGVAYVAIASPPRPDGTLASEILAAAQTAGVDAVYAMGGAQAVAAFAHGTGQVPAVDMVVGPGNIYVTLAKREVFGRVGIDMLAGPSEVLIIADKTCPPRFAAADLLSQAEHGETSAAVLVTHCALTGQQIADVLAEMVSANPRAPVLRKALAEYGGIVVTQSLDESIELANLLAPEHLQLMIEDPELVVPRLVSAGAVFCGPWAPTPLGDYLAGPSHVLPTGGTGRFSSPLSVATFMKRTSVISYTEGALGSESKAIAEFARAEGLWAHGESARLRTQAQDL